jgi:AraC-like DNA-binding protein
MTRPDPPTTLRRLPAPPLRPFVSSITAYQEHGAAAVPIQRETASLDAPLVITLGGRFRLALDRPPGADDGYASFAAGLHPGFVAIGSDGGAACVQVNFTPLGARLALGLPMDALASRMVPLVDLGDPGLAELADRLAGLPGWPARLALAEAWATARIRTARPLDPAVLHAYRLLRLTGGCAPIGALAARLGWSRKRLVAGFRREIGLPPKALARVLRFMRAERMARAAPPAWADIAAACGYADQPHLVREFQALAGATPTAWAAGEA